MPTYSYRCTKCEKVFDAFHSMMCDDPQMCPCCGVVGKKLMSASSVIFKGSGFYSTDYRDSGYLEAKKNDGDKPVKASDSTDSAVKKDAESKTDSTPRTETTAKPETASKSDTVKPPPSSPVSQAA